MTQMQESNSSLKERLGTALQQQRARRGLTQAQLANLAGVSPKYIGEIERGDANPTLDLLVSVVETIGWDPLGGGDDRLGGRQSVLQATLLTELQRTVGRLDVIMSWLQAMMDPTARPVADLHTLLAQDPDPVHSFRHHIESTVAIAGRPFEDLPPRRKPGRPRRVRTPQPAVPVNTQALSNGADHVAPAVFDQATDTQTVDA